MPDDQILDQVRMLRDRGQTPKQVGRTLGLTSAEAARLVRAAALAAEADTTQPALVGCWISPFWSTGLAVGDHPDWPVHENPSGEPGGMVSVLVARRPRYGRVSVCGYLTDLYCLGVKNALGPELMSETRLRPFVRDYFARYHGDPLPVPIELAREVVFGSIEYARGLGFEPHPDFAAAQEHLGSWTRAGNITFGMNGKPMYFPGPYDDQRQVIRTLKRTVGPGNFDFLSFAD